ncbi:MAG: hypothetical protein ABSE73_04970 [Planctomycetota bacterium]
MAGMLSATALVSAGQPAAQVPIKGDMLDGSRLVLRSAGVSVDLPGAGWKWMTYEGDAGKTCLCVNASSGVTYLVAVGQLHGEFTDHQPQSLIDNARKRMVANGGKLENDKFEWVELPGTRKCARVAFTEVDKAGKKTLAVFYIAQTIGSTSLKLQFTGAMNAEPDAFSKMARSLKALP